MLPLYVLDNEDNPIENSLVIIDPQGEVVLDLCKYCMTRITGTRTGNKKIQTVATSFGDISGVVCCDVDSTWVISQAGCNGTDILLVPSLDLPSGVNDPYHTRMVIFRAIENGFSLIRQTDNGLSVAVDPFGRLLAQVDHFTATERVMVVQVPVKGVFTIYSYIPGFFAWLSVGGFIFLRVFALILRCKQSIKQKGE